MITQRDIISHVCKTLPYSRGIVYNVFKGIEHHVCDELYNNARFKWQGLFSIARNGDNYVTSLSSTINLLIDSGGNLNLNLGKRGIKSICKRAQLSEMEISEILSCVQSKLIHSLRCSETVMLLDGIYIGAHIDNASTIKFKDYVNPLTICKEKYNNRYITVGLYSPYSTYGEVCRYRRQYAHDNKSQKQ